MQISGITVDKTFTLMATDVISSTSGGRIVKTFSTNFRIYTAFDFRYIGINRQKSYFVFVKTDKALLVCMSHGCFLMRAVLFFRPPKFTINGSFDIRTRKVYKPFFI